MLVIDSVSEAARIVDTTLKTVVRLDMDVPDGYDIIVDTGSRVLEGNFEPAQSAPEEVAPDYRMANAVNRNINKWMDSSATSK